jgi:peptidoglycan hydrolase CwlO-like protein
VAVASLEELLAENAALREELAGYKAKLTDVLEQLDDIKNDMAETLADNEMMARVFEANDQVKESMAEVERYRAVAEQAERNLAARSHEFNERARNVRYWKFRAEKAEKQLTVTD